MGEYLVEVRAATGHRLLVWVKAVGEREAMLAARVEAHSRWTTFDVDGTRPSEARVLEERS